MFGWCYGLSIAVRSGYSRSWFESIRIEIEDVVGSRVRVRRARAILEGSGPGKDKLKTSGSALICQGLGVRFVSFSFCQPVVEWFLGRVAVARVCRGQLCRGLRKVVLDGARALERGDDDFLRGRFPG
jgi:hypothetical protein